MRFTLKSTECHRVQWAYSKTETNMETAASFFVATIYENTNKIWHNVWDGTNKVSIIKVHIAKWALKFNWTESDKSVKHGLCHHQIPP